MKTDRSAFLYLDPASPSADEQCGTCFMWVRGDRCMIHGPRIKVTKTMSCGFYLNGDPLPKGTQTQILTTPDESGLVDRPVRCENCNHFDGESERAGECGLYKELNRKLPDIFKLDTRVDPKGCCNAQEPKVESKARKERLAEAQI